MRTHEITCFPLSGWILADWHFLLLWPALLQSRCYGLALFYTAHGRLNPAGHAGLSALDPWIGLPFIALAAALLMSAIGWLRCDRRAWMLGVSVISVNLASDLFHLAERRLEDGIDCVIAGVLLLYDQSRRP